MSKGISIHLGLNSVDPAHYGGAYPLGGCHNDANDMAAIANAAGYRSTVLLDAAATAGGFLDAMAAASNELQAGDTLLVTYAGHGAQIPDEDGDEPDGLDETWVVYDRMIVDDEIHAALSRVPAGVRVLLVSDSCHSGSIARHFQYQQLTREGPRLEGYASDTRFRTPGEPEFGRRVWGRHADTYRAIARSTPRNARELVRATVIQIAACQDDQLSADGVGNGLFTSKLKQIWASGDFRGDHPMFVSAIRKVMPVTQTPGYLVFGDATTAFERQRPFTVEPPASRRLHRPGVDRLDGDGQWPAIRDELTRRFPGCQLPVEAAPPHGDHRSLAIPGPATRAASGAPIVRAFWWGFHIECSSQSLRDLLNAADPASALAAAIGPATGPAAPFVLAAAAFVKSAVQLLRGLDHGNGVYIAMSWFLPGIFVPTTVPGDRGRALAPRDPGAPYEQAGDPWRRAYSGGLFGLRLEDDIYWNLPDGTVRDEVIVHLNPPGFGNVHFNGWLSNDPTVGHFRLHVGVAAFQAGTVEVRMMIRDREGRRTIQLPSGARALTASELTPPSSVRRDAPSPARSNGVPSGGFVGNPIGS